MPIGELDKVSRTKIPVTDGSFAHWAIAIKNHAMSQRARGADGPDVWLVLLIRGATLCCRA